MNCPNCRVDMAWLVEILSPLSPLSPVLPPLPPLPPPPPPLPPPPLPKCPICMQHIGLDVAWIRCRNCDSAYHQNELVENATQLNRAQQPVFCRVCDADMRWVLQLPAAPASPNDLDIQPIELNIDINNFNWDSQSESETDAY
ncbi:unnamed protein product [Adineta steineri]|uniref:Uncharacterized protein n=1 Tax=Adineta steineri TaxID=433720 RepID=A0A815M5Y8_9BILA|nr:unnamed protein product [Adineta steineri]CAF1617893.1 unnamed protein product [Adineta steineri]